MRFLVLADLHANLEALQAVLADVSLDEFDMALVLGDLVGYGPNPNEVIASVRSLPIPFVVIRGNHDRVASGSTSSEGFNRVAARAAEWTAAHLTPESREYLLQLGAGPKGVAPTVEALTVEVPSVEICHGSPYHEDDYIVCDESAARAFAAATEELVFFGHTHLPSRFHESSSGVRLALPAEGVSHELVPGERYLLNPGSVGQPRDKDPRASYMTYSSVERRAVWRRVAYPIRATVEKMRTSGLPEPTARRLFVGE